MEPSRSMTVCCWLGVRSPMIWVRRRAAHFATSRIEVRGGSLVSVLRRLCQTGFSQRISEATVVCSPYTRLSSSWAKTYVNSSWRTWVRQPRAKLNRRTHITHVKQTLKRMSSRVNSTWCGCCLDDLNWRGVFIPSRLALLHLAGFSGYSQRDLKGFIFIFYFLSCRNQNTNWL